MLDVLVLHVGQVVDLEELLDLVNAFRGQVDLLFLLVDDEVAGLLFLFVHDHVHLGQFLGLALFQAGRQIVAGLVEFR